MWYSKHFFKLYILSKFPCQAILKPFFSIQNTVSSWQKSYKSLVYLKWMVGIHLCYCLMLPRVIKVEYICCFWCIFIIWSAIYFFPPSVFPPFHSSLVFLPTFKPNLHLFCIFSSFCLHQTENKMSVYILWRWCGVEMRIICCVSLLICQATLAGTARQLGGRRFSQT